MKLQHITTQHETNIPEDRKIKTKKIRQKNTDYWKLTFLN